MLISLPKYLTTKYNNNHNCETIESYENTYKNDLIQWVKKQNINEVAVNSKKITSFIIRMYLHDLLVERSNYALKDENPKFPTINEDIATVCLVRKRRSHEEENKHLEQKLLSKICIVDQDDIFDKFCLQGSLEDIINLLIECSNGLAFTSQPKVSFNSLTKQYIVNDAIWFNPKTYQTCAGWVINEFEKAIALIYYQQTHGNQSDNNLFQNEDLKKYWISDGDFKIKVMNQIPQICKEFKNAPKKKTTKQEDIQWTSFILKKIANSCFQNNSDLTINEEQIHEEFKNNDFDSVYYLRLETITKLQSLCEKRILRMIRDQFKDKLMKDLQEIEGKEKEKRKHTEQKKKSKKNKKQKNKVEATPAPEPAKNIVSDDKNEKSNSFEIIEKQDTTQDEVHCAECEQNKHSNSCQENVDNVLASAQEQFRNEKNQIEIIEILKNDEIIHSKEDQLDNDDENWVIITAPKKQRKQVSRKFASQNDLNFKPQQQQKHPQTTPKPQHLSEQQTDKSESKLTKIHSLKLPEDPDSATHSKQEFKQQPMSEQKIIDKQSSSSDERNSEPLEIKQEGSKNFSPSQIIKLEQLSLHQNNLKFDDEEPIQIKAAHSQGYYNLPMFEQQRNPFWQYENIQNEDYVDPIIMNQARALMIKKLDMDMREFNEMLLSQNQEILQIRKLIYDRLQFVINYLFRDFNSNVRLFGSCATGLALPESDIDIGITGFELYPTSQLNIPIQKIIEFLSKMKWVTNIKAINSATMPLIKLQVDPRISFTDSTLSLPLPLLDLTLDPDFIIPNQYFSVDISFFQFQGPKTVQHLGQISTELTLQWLSFYAELRPLVLLFKSLLKKRGLNDQYKGGLSSFCIIQMVLAFLEHSYQQNQASSIGFTTYRFLKFYGTEFDAQKTGISYKGFNQDPFYQLNEYDDHLEITIVSPITNEIISQASSFVQTIMQDIKALYLATENEVIFFYEKIKYNKKKRGKKEERNLFQKELNKFRPLFSNTVYKNT